MYFQFPRKYEEGDILQLQKHIKCGTLEFLIEITYGETSITVSSNLASGHDLYS